MLEPLLDFLSVNGLDAPDDLSATPIGDGHSNVTFMLSTGVVLRRPPRGPLPPSAHDVLREARLLGALESTNVRVPRVLAVCDDSAVIGSPFYVMKQVSGNVITDSLPPALDEPAERARIADQLIDALVEVHAVDWREVGLDGFGKPSGYLERQLRRFGGLWEHNKTRELPEVEALGRWLGENMPESPPATIVHGDYRLGNTMFADEAPARLVAIFDWEMATIGDPLADLGYMVMQWAAPDDPPSKFNLHTVTRLEGFPPARSWCTVTRSAQAAPMGALNWYVTLALWKAVVFMEGNYKRAVAGSTDDPYLKSFGEGVLEIAQRALHVSRMGSSSASPPSTRASSSTGAA